MKRLVLTWVGLVGLMLASLGCSTLHMGLGNTIAGIGIAVVKAVLVGAIFMGLARGAAMLRLIAAAAVGGALILAGLSLVDFIPRPDDPASYQAPRQLAPVMPSH